MAYAIIFNMCGTFWMCNMVIFGHVCHESTNSDMRELWHDSLWLKIREEFNISALIDYSLLVWQDHEQDFPIIFCNAFTEIDQCCSCVGVDPAPNRVIRTATGKWWWRTNLSSDAASVSMRTANCWPPYCSWMISWTKEISNFSKTI